MNHSIRYMRIVVYTPWRSAYKLIFRWNSKFHRGSHFVYEKLDINKTYSDIHQETQSLIDKINHSIQK